MVTEVYPEGYKIGYFLLALAAVLIVSVYRLKGRFGVINTPATGARAQLVPDSFTIAFSVSNPSEKVVTLSSPTLVIKQNGNTKKFQPRGGAFQVFPLSLFPLTTHEFKVDCNKLVNDMHNKPTAMAWLEIQLSNGKLIKTNKVRFERPAQP